MSCSGGKFAASIDEREDELEPHVSQTSCCKEACTLASMRRTVLEAKRQAEPQPRRACSGGFCCVAQLKWVQQKRAAQT